VETKLKLIATIKNITKTSNQEQQNVPYMLDVVTVNDAPISDGRMNDILSIKPVRSVRQSRSIRRNHSLPIRPLN
jgi:hypothetical protein